MATMTRWGILGLLGLAAVVIIVSARSCIPDNGPDTSRGLDPLVSAMCDTEEFAAVARRVMREDTTLLVSARDLLDMEVHDCQALIMADTLGPRVALLVSTDRVEAENFSGGLVVAEVVNHSAQAYVHGRLRIEPMTVSCLWIQGGPHTRWTAAVVVPPEGQTCVTADFDPQAVVRLPVNRLEHGGDTYPSTGRWMWDHENRGHFIGIRCGSGWCETGSPDFYGTQSLPDVASVPGWYDEQLLSYMPDGADELRLSGLLGRITPVRGLVDVPDSAYAEPEGIQVAVLTFTPTGTPNDAEARAYYHARFNLDGTEETHPLFLRNAGGQWEMKTGPQSTWTAVHRREDHRHSGKGTVRWAWIETDEGAWIPCAAGCCMGQEIR